jgi:predicted nucleic acid-binding protein
MTTYVVDVSVGTEYLLRTHIGLKIAETRQGAQLIAPKLLDVEVLSVLRRALLGKKLSEE